MNNNCEVHGITSFVLQQQFTIRQVVQPPISNQILDAMQSK